MKLLPMFAGLLFAHSITAMEQIDTSGSAGVPQLTSTMGILKEYGSLAWDIAKKDFGDDAVVDGIGELLFLKQKKHTQREEDARVRQRFPGYQLGALSVFSYGRDGCCERECEHCLLCLASIACLYFGTVGCIAGSSECPVITAVGTVCCAAAACKAAIRQKYGLPQKED